MALGIPINRAAKDGRSVGHTRRAISTGTTTAAGFPRFVIVVGSPFSAASIKAEKHRCALRNSTNLIDGLWPSFTVIASGAKQSRAARGQAGNEIASSACGLVAMTAPACL
jgi:hypothetical protein